MIEGLDEALERVKDDPGLRAALEAARSWGVAPLRFFGREPKTHVLRDGDGRELLAREPEWTDEDRALAIALGLYEADLCPGCRHPLSETTKPENEGLYRPLAPIRCHRCTASSMGADRYADSPHASALLLSVELLTGSEGA
jgi:hypothetical protein